MKHIFQIVVYRLLLDFSFITIVSKLWAYGGSILDFDFYKYLISWIMTVLLAYVLSVNKSEKYSSIAQLILVYISCIPGLSLMGLKNISYEAMILFFCYWLIMNVLFNYIGKINIKHNVQLPSKLSKLIFPLVLVSSIIVILYSSWKYTGFRFNLSLNVEDLRSFRFEMRDTNFPTIIKYLLPLSTTVIIPIAAGVKFIEKKYLVVAFLYFIVVLAFSINGMKSWLVYTPVVIFFIIFSKKIGLKRIKLGIPSCFVCLVFVSSLSYFLFNSVELVALTIYRIIYIPAEINFHYFDFFSLNPILLLRESIFQGVFDAPYQVASSMLIGAQISGEFGNNANNGLFGDAYANFGVIGILIYPFFIVLIYRIIDFLSINVNKGIMLGIIMCLVWGSINISFFTWLSTGGVLVSMFMMLLIKKYKMIENLTYEH